MRARPITAALAVAGALIAAGPAWAETITVTSTADTTQCDVAACTLRGAFVRAEQNGSGVQNTINVPAGDYVVASALETGTTRDLTLVGAGANVTAIRGTGADRVLVVGGEASLTLQRVTIAGGRALGGDETGGNITASGASLSLDHVRVTGGASSTGGGGIAVQQSRVTITHSLIDGNSAGTGEGGGILSDSGETLVLSDTTVTGNTAAAGGGGILTRGTIAVPASLTRVTIAGNTSQNTVGGGLAGVSGLPAVIQGSILAANAGGDCAGAEPTDSGGNLESGTACGFVRAESRQTADTGLADALVSDGGQLPVLPISAISPARDLAGACTGSDQRDMVRPQGALCDAGAYEYAPPPPPPVEPTPTPAPTATPPPVATPVAGKSVGAEPVSGKVLVKVNGKFVPLGDSVIQNGTEIDTRKGKVKITTSSGEIASFYDGIFKVSQSRGITTVTLTEKLAACPSRKAHAAAKKPKTRKLWGDGKGKFRTKGSYSAATVRGTKWLVQDGCRYTRTTVTAGTVDVHDDVKKKTFLLRKGKTYTARPRR